jgi:hypothetical protein
MRSKHENFQSSSAVNFQSKTTQTVQALHMNAGQVGILGNAKPPGRVTRTRGERQPGSNTRVTLLLVHVSIWLQALEQRREEIHLAAHKKLVPMFLRKLPPQKLQLPGIRTLQVAIAVMDLQHSNPFLNKTPDPDSKQQQAKDASCVCHARLCQMPNQVQPTRTGAQLEGAKGP